MPTVEKVLRELAVFPLASLVQLLEDAGARGVPGDPCYCPIAVYLAEATGVSAESLEVFANNTCYGIDEDAGGGSFIENPPCVAEFIDAFDCGRWPQLLREEDQPAWLL